MDPWTRGVGSGDDQVDRGLRTGPLFSPFKKRGRRRRRGTCVSFLSGNGVFKEEPRFGMDSCQRETSPGCSQMTPGSAVNLLGSDENVSV